MVNHHQWHVSVAGTGVDLTWREKREVITSFNGQYWLALQGEPVFHSSMWVVRDTPRPSHCTCPCLRPWLETRIDWRSAPTTPPSCHFAVQYGVRTTCTSGTVFSLCLLFVAESLNLPLPVCQFTLPMPSRPRACVAGRGNARNRLDGNPYFGFCQSVAAFPPLPCMRSPSYNPIRVQARRG